MKIRITLFALQSNLALQIRGLSVVGRFQLRIFGKGTLRLCRMVSLSVSILYAKEYSEYFVPTAHSIYMIQLCLILRLAFLLFLGQTAFMAPSITNIEGGQLQ